MIVLDNVSIHTNDDITRVLQEAVYVIRYLPPYSPDYNPSELTFAMLEAWICRNCYYVRLRFPCGRGFGELLKAAVAESSVFRLVDLHYLVIFPDLDSVIDLWKNTGSKQVFLTFDRRYSV